MAFKNIEWGYTGEKEKEYVEPEAGLRYLYITDARFDETTHQYDVFVADMHNEAEFRLRYWIDSIDKNTNQFKPDYKQRGSLIRLGRALAGPDLEIGIPHPSCIVGGVVQADVILTPNRDGTRNFAKVVEFFPVDKAIAELAAIDQYYIDEPVTTGDEADGAE